MNKKYTYTIIENRVEQWETHFYIPELKIGGTEREGLIDALVQEVFSLREHKNYKYNTKELINYINDIILDLHAIEENTIRKIMEIKIRLDNWKEKLEKEIL